MNKLLIAVMTFVLTAATATAQDPKQVYTRPALPPREALDRLNLKLGWYVGVPMDGTRDGIFTLQFAGRQILVQTRSGLILALDRDTGQTLWRNRVGVPYEVSHPLGYNQKAVFVVHGTWLYALDRATGALQWQFNLPDAASAGPAADSEQIYLGLNGGGLIVYLLPEVSRHQVTLTGIAANKNYLPREERGKVTHAPTFYGGTSGTGAGIGPLASAAVAGRSRESGPQPVLRSTGRAGIDVEQPPLLTNAEVLWAGANGTVAVVPKRTDISLRPYRFLAEGRISVPPAQYGDTAYIAAHNGSLYALHVPSGKVLWRFTGGNPITQKPAVTNEDVYVAPDGSGLYRLDRLTGDTIWRNRTAERFLAANPKFVYAADRHGRLMVLDRARGTTLSVYDGTREFVWPISNEHTDRLYLAAHSGLLVCLHDRDYEAPLVTKEDQEKLLAPPDQPQADAPFRPDQTVPTVPGDKPPGPPGDKPPALPGEKMPEKPGAPGG
ncbi:MAG TPA: PQQ-binding-like beta-propeller repeat protein [Gemmataceae bacterium]|nr:PQQ-binding-like beta-propeller repeat protein [Gemmataceae bacterium]